jgi:prepilin-type N-terminal cleavage/methylation domain-containing protein
MRNEKGFTLIEVLVSLVLLGIIGGAFLGSMGTASKAIFVADEQATAESLARSQMEYIKKHGYDAIYNPPHYGIDPDLDIPDGYEIITTAERLDPDSDGTDDDDNIQSITVTVSHGGKELITLEDYKVNR